MVAGATDWKFSPGEPKTPFGMAQWMKRSGSSRTLLALLLWLHWLLPSGRCWAYHCNQKYRKFSLRHTLCLPPRPDCHIFSAGVSRKDIEEILAAHNGYRQQVANGQVRRLAPAADMMELVWDNELAAVAQAHAKQCHFHHDCHACRRVSRFTTGQNLFLHYSSSLKEEPTSWTNVVKSWFDENKIFDVSEVDSFQTVEDSGHFSQVIWAKTSHVGCGKARFKMQGEDWYKTLYTCNYGPIGNVITSKIYEKGSPCSRCPNNTACSVSKPGLCSLQARSFNLHKGRYISSNGFQRPNQQGHNGGYISSFRFPGPDQQGGMHHQGIQVYKLEVPMKQSFAPALPDAATLQTPQQIMQPQQLEEDQPHYFQTFVEQAPEWQQEDTSPDGVLWRSYGFGGKRSQREPSIPRPAKITEPTMDQSKNIPCQCDAKALKRMREKIIDMLSSVKGVQPTVEIKCKCGDSFDAGRSTWS